MKITSTNINGIEINLEAPSQLQIAAGRLITKILEQRASSGWKGLHAIDVEDPYGVVAIVKPNGEGAIQVTARLGGRVTAAVVKADVETLLRSLSYRNIEVVVVAKPLKSQANLIPAELFDRYQPLRVA